MNRLFNLSMIVALLASLLNFQDVDGAKNPTQSQDTVIPQTAIIQPDKPKKVPDVLILEVEEGTSLEKDQQGKANHKFKTNSP